MDNSNVKIRMETASNSTPNKILNSVHPGLPNVRKVSNRDGREPGITRTQSLREASRLTNVNIRLSKNFTYRKNLGKILENETEYVGVGQGQGAVPTVNKEKWLCNLKRTTGLQRSNSVRDPRFTNRFKTSGNSSVPVVVGALPKTNVLLEQPIPTQRQDTVEIRSSLVKEETPTQKSSAFHTNFALNCRRGLEEDIFQKLKAIPSVIFYHSQDVGYSPTWNWTYNLRAVKEQAEKESECSVSFRIISQFNFQVETTINLIQQIHHDFLHGLADYNPSNPNKEMDAICRQLDICSTRSTSRNSVSHATLPYISDIFKNELTRQTKWQRWIPSVLTQPSRIKKRTEIVRWILETSKSIKYSTETTHLAVYLVDAYLSCPTKTHLGNCEIGLLSICALHLAGKLEEANTEPMKRLVRLQGQYFRTEDLLRMEGEILRRLKLNVYPPIAPYFANLVLIGGSLDFPYDLSGSFRKLTQDISLGILHQSLLNHKLVSVHPAEKAKMALEVAVEYIYIQYKYSQLRDMSAFHLPAHNPGHSLGEFALDICVDHFAHRLIRKPEKRVFGVAPVVASPVKNIRV